MHAILAFTPILLAIILMVWANWPANKSLPLALLLTGIISFLVWKMDIRNIFAYPIFGVLKSFDVLITIFGAILIL